VWTVCVLLVVKRVGIVNIIRMLLEEKISLQGVRDAPVKDFPKKSALRRQLFVPVNCIA